MAKAATLLSFQMPGDGKINRMDHVWFRKGGRYKCCLCGAITNVPPNYPTPENFQAESYESVTEMEKEMCPNKLICGGVLR